MENQQDKLVKTYSEENMTQINDLSSFVEILRQTIN